LSHVILKHNMNAAKITTIMVLLGIVVGLTLFSRSKNNDSIDNPEILSYSSPTLGVSFQYPKDYYLEEKNTGTPQRNRTTVILYEDTLENKEVREGTAPPREGPVAITLDFFQNAVNESYTPENWVRGTNNSNFKLSPDSIITETSVDDKEAVAYRWSGLYEGQSVVFVHRNHVVMASVTYLTPEDEIISVFNDLMKSLSLEQ
jgi:hypothetical protein